MESPVVEVRINNNIHSIINFDKKTLTVIGTGSIPDYKKNKSPWAKYKTVIETVIIQEGILYIGAYSFFEFKQLHSFLFPDSLKKIGPYSFYKCDLIDTNTSQWGGVEYIGEAAFMWCNSPQFNQLPPHLIDVGVLGFACLKKITELYLPPNTKHLSIFAFGGCSGVEKLSIPKTIDSIDGGFLEEAHNLKLSSIHFYDPDNQLIECKYKLDYKNNIMYKNDALIQFFYNPDYDKCNFIVPNYITKIYPAAFYRAYGLTNITLHENIQYIGYKAFGNTRRLEKIIIPKNVTAIGKGLFFSGDKKGISNLSTVIFDCAINTIDNDMFRGAYNLKTLIINENKPLIEEDAFKDAKSLVCIICKNGLHMNVPNHQYIFEKNNRDCCTDGDISPGLYIRDNDCVFHFIHELDASS